MRTALYVMALGVSAALVGCHAEVRTKADFSVSANEREAEEKEVADDYPDEPTQAVEAKSLREPKAAAPTRPAFIGVTPDLTLAPSSSRAPSCQCLAVAHGEPGDTAFEWEGGPPASDERAMAIAISGDGVPCSWDSKGAPVPTPSIAAVERSGQDVVVTVEPAVAGRPVMRGAMILRPGSKGALIIRGSGKVPFGRSADGSNGTCRIAVE